MKHEIKVVTYNLMCVWDHPKNIKGLTYRAGLVYAKIKKENPDIIGFQEVIAPQLEYFRAHVSGIFIHRSGSKCGYDGRRLVYRN